jgi:hypothetical protein
MTIAQSFAADPAKPAVKIPFMGVFVASDAVTKDNLEYQALSYPVWPLPEEKGVSVLELGIRVTNRNSKPVSFLPIVGTPVLKTTDGKAVLPRGPSIISPQRLPEVLSIEPSKSITAYESCLLHGSKKGPSLNWKQAGGAWWLYDRLQSGPYVLQLRYQTQGEAGEARDVLTKGITIVLRKLNASNKVFSNGLAVSALADQTWRAPEPGKHTFINIGFRLTNVKGPNSAGVIPSISTVTITSSGGVSTSAAKTGQIIPRRPPQVFHMVPDISYTYAEPLILSNTGKSLALTGADGHGNGWQIKGLHPGKYMVRYVIQGQKGATPDAWTSWTGEIKTAEIEVEIK